MLGLAGLALDPARSAAFLGAFLPFAERVARLGAQNSLAQTVLKLTLPGVPDIYQGTELWDLSLVDPDNRRPVDYALRQRLLEILETAADDRQGAMARYLRSWQDAQFKLAAMAAILGFRREAPILFAEGDYEGLLAEGDGADEVCAFSRRQGDAAMLVAVARFPGAARNPRRAAGRDAARAYKSLQGGAVARAPNQPERRARRRAQRRDAVP